MKTAKRVKEKNEISLRSQLGMHSLKEMHGGGRIFLTYLPEDFPVSLIRIERKVTEPQRGVNVALITPQEAIRLLKGSIIESIGLTKDIVVNSRSMTRWVLEEDTQKAIKSTLP